MSTETKNQKIAKTILEQLGGNKFIAMTGAKNLGAGENYLSFKIGRNASKATHIKITLNCMDTYDMEFIKCRKFEAKTLNILGSIYAEDLQRIFTSETGLNTSL
jgi:hypothetical protein